MPSLPQDFGNPDAVVGHTRTDGTLCGYRSGLLVDAKWRIIVAVIFVALNCVEAPLVIQALDKQYAIFRSYLQGLGMDSAFDHDEVHTYLEAHHIAGGITIRSRPGAAGVFHAVSTQVVIQRERKRFVNGNQMRKWDTAGHEKRERV